MAIAAVIERVVFIIFLASCSFSHGYTFQSVEGQTVSDHSFESIQSAMPSIINAATEKNATGL